MDFDLRDLRYFQTIAELGHLGRAADQLARSQPALTKCVRRLEDSVGAVLFERKGRGIQLTPVGRMLLAKARPLLNAAANTFREVQAFSHGEAGHVRIGSGPITAEYLLPNICRLILSRSPGITVEIAVGTNHFLREQLKRGEIDLAVGLVRDNDHEFKTHPLIEDVVVVAAGTAHPVFRQDPPTLRDLLQYGWVLPIAAVASRQWLDRKFESQGLPAPRAQIEANSIPMLGEVIAGTEMLCFVSRHTLSRHQTFLLKEVELEDATLRRWLGVTFSDSRLSPAVARVLSLLCDDRKWIGGEW
jgi:DNA-binding transcriptional LysR family regulator